MEEKYKKEWEECRNRELSALLSILSKLGFEIEKEQPHMGGERYLMQAVTTTSGKKLILIGKRKNDGKRVVIKATSDKDGIRELEHERVCRNVLQKINFAYKTFLSPEEILFVKKDRYLISIQEFVAQDKTFLEHTIKEQFGLTIKAFEAQEGAHATAYSHMGLVKKNFGSIDAEGYLKNFNSFKNKILESRDNENLRPLLEKAERELIKKKEIIEQYTRFLTHTDFVPHNIRVVGENIYLLDHSSFRFGNKYEGWARFCNFMILYNPHLERALVKYVAENRTEEESIALYLMRIYRLGEIIWYYVSILDKSYGNLLTLNQKRVEFWSKILEYLLSRASAPDSFIEEYKKTRDSLRSADEKKRQLGLH